MPRFAANLSMLFTEVGFLDRFAAASKAGFTGVEYLFPYDHDPRLLRQRLDDHHLTQVLHNLPAGNWAAGDRGIACDPRRTAEFAAGVEQAVEFATVLGCSQVNCLAGITPPGVHPAQARETLIDNLRHAAGRLQGAGIKLLIEPINTRDIPGFFLNRSSQAMEIIDAVASENLFLQFDAYHMQVMEGDLATSIERLRGVIKHIQVADPPGRHEPGTGEINFTFLFDWIDRVGYAGWIGCEYKPVGSTEEGLGWLRGYLRPGPSRRDG